MWRKIVVWGIFEYFIPKPKDMVIDKSQEVMENEWLKQNCGSHQLKD